MRVNRIRTNQMSVSPLAERAGLGHGFRNGAKKNSRFLQPNSAGSMGTVEKLVDVTEQEGAEDFEKMAAMAQGEKPYPETSVFYSCA